MDELFKAIRVTYALQISTDPSQISTDMEIILLNLVTLKAMQTRMAEQNNKVRKMLAQLIAQLGRLGE